MTSQRMGRGIRALLSSSTSQEPVSTLLKIDEIRPNPRQPRKTFDSNELQLLASTIKEKGLLQPIVVRSLAEGGYEIISGERRWRAMKLAEKDWIPAVVREDVSDSEMLALALIENVQRKDLDPIEKAQGFSMLTEFGITQNEVAELIGLNRASVSNLIRLLDLPEDVQQLVSRGVLRMGHARAVLGAPDAETQRQLALIVVKKGLSVRETEDLVSRSRPEQKRRQRAKDSEKRPSWVDALEGRLGEHYGRTVRIRHAASGGGVLQIHYSSEAELQSTLDKMGLGEESAQF